MSAQLKLVKKSKEDFDDWLEKRVEQGKLRLSGVPCVASREAQLIEEAAAIRRRLRPSQYMTEEERLTLYSCSSFGLEEM